MMRNLHMSLLIIFLLLVSVNTYGQDFFGRVKSPFTNELTDMAVNSQDNIFAGTWGDGVYKSTDEGVTWDPVNSGLTNLHVNCVFIAPNNDIYASTEGGGIFISKDNGVNWDPINNGLTNLNVRVVNKHENGTLFAGTYGNGIFKSTDNGANWVESNTGLDFQDVRALTFAVNDDYVIAGTWGGGVYRSSDNGKTWFKSNTGISKPYIFDFVINSVGEILASTNGSGLRYSVDNGATWSEFNNQPWDKNVTSCVINKDQEPVVGTMTYGLFYWDEMVYVEWKKTNFRDGGISTMAINSKGTIFAFSSKEGFMKSTDKGRTFAKVSLANNRGINSINVNRRNGQIWCTANNSGAYFSTNHGLDWIEAGLESNFVHGFAFDSSSNIYAGTGDGIYKTTNMGANWVLIGPKDSVVGDMVIEPNGTIHGAGVHYYKSTNGGTNWSIVDISGAPNQMKAIGMNYNGDLYAGSSSAGTFRSTNSGTNWSVTLPYQEALTIEDIAFNSSGDVFLGSMDGLSYSTNNGTSWTTIDFGLEYPWVKNVAINTSNNIFAGLFYFYGIYFTTDGGQDWDSLVGHYYAYPTQGLTSDTYGFTYLGTNVIYTAIDSARLGIPNLVSPDNNAVILDKNPSLDWDDAENAHLYEIYLSDKDSFNYKIENVVSAKTIREVETELEYNKTYYWKVRSKMHSSLGAWSPVRTFRTTLAPPVLISPANGSKGVKQTSDFNWNSVEGAETYVLEVSLTNDFADPVKTYKDIADTTVEVSGLKPYKDYFWRVKAVNTELDGIWSEIWTFKTVVAPPILRVPANHTKDLATSVKMEWYESQDAVSYIIQIAKDIDFTNKVYDGPTEKKDSHTITLLEYDSKYFWRVIAKNADGESLWSEVWDFTTIMDATNLISPENGSTAMPLKINFRWGDFEGADSYNIRIATDSAFNQIVYENDDPILVTSVEVDIFNNFKSYYWQVSINKGERTGRWTDMWMLRTVLAAPALKTPVNGAEKQNTSVFLIWETVTGAEKYNAQIADDELFANIISETNTTKSPEFGVDDLEKETTYYWRARALFEDEPGLWSDVWSFKTDSVINSIDYLDETALGLRIYPNPFSTDINILFNTDPGDVVKIDIHHIDGRIVRNLYFGVTDSKSMNLKWKPESISTGNYFMMMNINGRIISKELIYIR